MYAFIRLGGHQHKVEKDQVIVSDLTGHEPGAEFSCTDVLCVANGADLKVGKPLVSGAQVKLKVLENLRSPKIRGFKYKRRKGYRKTWGHRQNLQKLQVVAIEG
jgi:large subunit ribosomal protein L21